MATTERPRGLPPRQAALKRGFDLCASGVGLLLTFWIILPAALLARLDSGESGFYRQTRVGRKGRGFTIVKLRTMRSSETVQTTVTTVHDPRLTRVGRLLRRTKIDELPQLFNVLLGQMSFVGPRPDVPGFADRLTGEDRRILELRPGITGPATLKYRDEERLLAAQSEPERYNREVIWPDKVRINLDYLEHYRFRDDLRYLWRTIFSDDRAAG